MTIITASAYLNASIFSTVGPIALLVGLVYWYVRTVGKLPWTRNEISKKKPSNDDNPGTGGSAAGGV